MTGAMMGLPQTSSGVVGSTATGFIPDLRFGFCYGVDTLDGAQNGLRKWDLWPNGAEIRARNTADLGTTQLYFPNCVTYRTQQLVISSGSSNSASLGGFSLMDLSYVATFGVVSSDLSNSANLRILAPGQLCAFTDSQGGDVVVSRTLIHGSSTGGQEINLIQWPRWNNKFNIPENQAVIGSIPDGSGKVAWVLGWNGGTAAMTLYKIGTVPGTIGTGPAAVGTVTPAQIDPTWTNVTAVVGITVDQTDGNPIIGFNTTDAVTSRARLVKLNQNTGAVVWSCAVGGSPAGVNYDVTDMSKNVVKYGRMYYLGSATNSLYIIDTVAGTAVQSVLSNSTVDATHGHQISEDVSGTQTVNGVTTIGGSVMWYGSWGENATHPNYLGLYCLVQGNHGGNSMGWRYWPNGAPNPAPTPGVPAASRKRAWSFTLDGHLFYVLDLGGQGTFLYDTITGNWCQFITQGYAAWNFANGCMWGQRIVAGDLVTTDVWEMQPSALFDNGANEIVHVVTGGIVTRERTYHSVENFTLACSVGQLVDSVNGATVTLSMSDDQGKTWVDMDTQTLTQGDYSAEIAWRSLGSFSSPGRMFKITDTGGFLRIDAADADIDNFDDPKQGA